MRAVLTQGLNDDELVGRVAAGDRSAFRDLFELYQPRLARFVGRMTRRDDLVEEIVNDVLVAVWKGAGSFGGRSRVSTWIFGIGYRIALKRLRSASRHLAEQELPAELRLVEDGPDEELDRRERDEQVRRALTHLNPEQRAVVELAFYHGLSYPEIAQIVDCPENTVKTRMFHARKKLRRFLPAGVRSA